MRPFASIRSSVVYSAPIEQSVPPGPAFDILPDRRAIGPVFQPKGRCQQQIFKLLFSMSQESSDARY